MSDLIEIPFFCEDFQAIKGRRERREYVVSELRRIDRAGHPILRTILSCQDDEAQAAATELLASNVDAEGGEIIPARLWRLRLVDDATPPATDPQGRRLPKDKVGKVLVAKVGNRGGRLGENAEPAEVDAHSGPRRTVTVRAGRDLYETVEVTRTPRSYSLRNAILILRQWGVGCTYERARVEPDKDNNPIEVQVYWLVEEVPEVRESTGETEAEAPKKRRAA